MCISIKIPMCTSSFKLKVQRNSGRQKIHKHFSTQSENGNKHTPYLVMHKEKFKSIGIFYVSVLSVA